MLISAAIIGFMGSFFSLMISKWMAKRTYNITPLTIKDYDNLNEKQKIVWDTVSELSRRNNIEMPEV
jgi:heat shock protein HtpX